MRQAMEIDVAIEVASDRQDSMWLTVIINEAKRGWRRAQRRCGRSRRRIGFVRPIAAAAVLGNLHSALVRWRPRAWKLGVSTDSVRVVRVRSQTILGSRRHSAEDVRKNEGTGFQDLLPASRGLKPGKRDLEHASCESVVEEDREQDDGVERGRSQSRCGRGRSIA